MHILRSFLATIQKFFWLKAFTTNSANVPNISANLKQTAWYGSLFRTELFVVLNSVIQAYIEILASEREAMQQWITDEVLTEQQTVGAWQSSTDHCEIVRSSTKHHGAGQRSLNLKFLIVSFSHFIITVSRFGAWWLIVSLSYLYIAKRCDFIII